MDSIGGMNVTCYPKGEVLGYILRHRDWRKDKKVMELCCGFLFSVWLEDTSGRDYSIGFPITEINRRLNQAPAPPLEVLLGDLSKIQDSDIDICLCWSERKERDLIKCQVTRLVDSDRIADPWERLKQLLDKKRLVQQDKSLTLIINIEDNVIVNQDKLQEYFDKTGYPYGNVVIVGKRSPQPGHFRLIHAWPFPVNDSEFETQLPV